MLVRMLQEGTCTLKIESYEANKHPKTGEVTEGKRLVASLNTVEPGFRVMLYPFRAGQSPPTTGWNRADKKLEVHFVERTDELRFSTTMEEGTKISLIK